MMIDAIGRPRNVQAAVPAKPVEAATPGVSAQVSTLAAQLAFSAADAAARAVPGENLAEKAERLLARIFAMGDSDTKAKADSEVPATDDPALLERARQATRFTNFLDGGEPNPFAGLSVDQLATIVYDESGTFTLNERRAAYYESSRIEQAFRRRFAAKMQDEYARTGKLTESFKDLLAHIQELPALERAQYPEHYEEELTAKIALDLRYR